jgi:hypothetical protein
MTSVVTFFSSPSSVNNSALPPTPKGRNYELRARNLREFAGLRRDDQRLDPFMLAQLAKILVVDFAAIEGLSEQAREHLLGHGAGDWSGGACSRPLPDGRKLVILNPHHGRHRHNTTLMEEICHLFLGHQPNRLAVTAQQNGGRTVTRDYNEADEEAAYSVGAAALVPYSSLRRFVIAGKTATQIARHFAVSRQLVIYRIKVSRLWDEYCTRNPEEAVFLSQHKNKSRQDHGK